MRAKFPSFVILHRRCRSNVSAVLGAALLLAAAGATGAEPEVVWHVFNLPPLYIVDGERKGEGIVDQALQRQLLPALSAYRHRIFEVPLQRLELTIKVEPQACALGLLKNPEREKTMLFSIPFLAQIPPGVLVRSTDRERVASYLERSGKLSLSRLLDDGRLVVGVGSARSYGATIDQLLAPYKGKPNLFTSFATRPAQSLLQMEAIGRVDVVPAFPYEASYLGIATGDGARALRFYPLAEQPDYILGHAVCSKSEFGAGVINAIDGVLRKRAVQDAIAGYYESWLDEESRGLAQRLRKQAFESLPRN